MCKPLEKGTQGTGIVEGDQQIYLIKFKLQVTSDEFKLNPKAISIT